VVVQGTKKDAVCRKINRGCYVKQNGDTTDSPCERSKPSRGERGKTYAPLHHRRKLQNGEVGGRVEGFGKLRGITNYHGGELKAVGKKTPLTLGGGRGCAKVAYLVHKAKPNGEAVVSTESPDHSTMEATSHTKVSERGVGGRIEGDRLGVGKNKVHPRGEK